jgi:hypothetical protein
MHGLSGLMMWLFVALCLGFLWEAPSLVREKRGRIMQDLRKFMRQDLRKFLGWLFAISSLLCLWYSPRLILLVIRQQSTLHLLRNLSIAALFPVLAAIYGVAWWTAWKATPFANGWGIAASLTYLLLPLGSFCYASRPCPGWEWMMSAGVAGLIAFSWRVGRPDLKPAS